MIKASTLDLAALTLRSVQQNDHDFLRGLYFQVYGQSLNLMHLETTQRETLLHLQFTAQQQQYQSQFPDATHDIILINELPVGQLRVLRTEEEIRLIDISLLPQFQKRGIGTALLCQLQAKATATSTPLRLTVLRTNQVALRLYQRLNFVITHSTDVHIEMEWQSATTD